MEINVRYYTWRRMSERRTSTVEAAVFEPLAEVDEAEGGVGVEYRHWDRSLRHLLAHWLLHSIMSA